MKILHIIAGAPTGGAETYALDVIAALAERGIAQHVVGRAHPIACARYQAAGVTFSRFDFSLRDRIRRATLRREAAQFGADLAHAWMARAADFIPRAMPCPVLGWCGGYYDLKYYRGADYLVGVTHDIARHLIASGAAASRVAVVHTFGTLPETPPIRRADLGTPESAPVILVLSRLHEKKGIDTILRAIATLPGVYLWLAGEGPERARYESLAASLACADRVRFLGWRTDRKSLLAACDVVALPSRYEPFGTVIPEAWSMHRPLVATRAAGASHYVTDGQTGLLCPIDDVPALATALHTALTDTPLRARLTEAGHAAYQADFERTRVIDTLLATYREAINQGGRK